MEDIKNPHENFLHFRELDIIPPGISLNVNESHTETTIRYDADKFPVFWKDILGPSMLLPLNAIHVSSGINYHHCPHIWLTSIVKGLKIQLHDDYINYIREGRMNSMGEDWNILAKSQISYVANRSFGLTTKVMRESDRLLLCEFQTLLLPIDVKTEKRIHQLPQVWKDKMLCQIAARGHQNTSLVLPTLHSTQLSIYSTTFTVKEPHADVFSHTNYMVHMFISLGCFKQALGERKLLPLEYNNVLIREINIVYEGLSSVGDNIDVHLFQNGNENLTFTVVLYKKHQRLSFSVIVCERISETKSKY